MLFKVSYDKEIHILKSVNAKTLSELKSLIPKVFKQHPQNFFLTYLDQDSDQITLATEADYGILMTCGGKSAKILIRQKSEDFYDETQKIQLQEEEPKEIEPVMQKEMVLNDVSEIQSNAQSIDESIEEKLRNMLPGLINRIKTEVQEEIMSESKMSGFSKPQDSTVEEKKPKVLHNHIICDGCGMKYIVGIRYKCAVCNDFDLCEKCEASSDHPHPFLKIKDPKHKPLKIIYIMEDQEDSLEVNGQRHNMNGLSNLIEQGLNFAQNFVQGFNIPQPEEKKEEKKQEKKQEKKVQPKVEEKVEKKVEPTIEKKVSKVEEKPEPKKSEIQKPVENSKEKRNDQIMTENANYLADIMNLEFTKAYMFSQKYPGLTKEELLNIYLTRPC